MRIANNLLGLCPIQLLCAFVPQANTYLVEGNGTVTSSDMPQVTVGDVYTFKYTYDSTFSTPLSTSSFDASYQAIRSFEGIVQYTGGTSVVTQSEVLAFPGCVTTSCAYMYMNLTDNQPAGGAEFDKVTAIATVLGHTEPWGVFDDTSTLISMIDVCFGCSPTLLVSTALPTAHPNPVLNNAPLQYGTFSINFTNSSGTQAIQGDVTSISITALPATYCTSGLSASGCQALISALGAASATASSGFVLSASGGEGAKDGLFFFGGSGRQANPWGNGTSYQCVVPPVRRAGLLSGAGTAGQCDGLFAQDLNALWCATCPKPQKNYGAGSVVQAQLWYRDPLNTSNQTTSLSDAIEFLVGP